MIEKVLEERGSRYGKFSEHAKIAQALQQILWNHPNWEKLPTDTRQSLVVITDKIARMLNGYHDYDDNWVDIIGYATLVLNRIREDERNESLTKQPADVVPQITSHIRSIPPITTLPNLYPTGIDGRNITAADISNASVVYPSKPTPK